MTLILLTWRLYTAYHQHQRWYTTNPEAEASPKGGSSYPQIVPDDGGDPSADLFTDTKQLGLAVSL